MPFNAHVQTAFTASSASAQILAANAHRKYLAIQNQSATEDVYVRTDGGVAAANNTSFKIGPGQTVVSVQVTIWNRGATNSQVTHTTMHATAGHGPPSRTTSAVDSTVNQNLTVTMQKVTGTEQVIIDACEVEVLSKS
jgi:hypothetical protein